MVSAQIQTEHMESAVKTRLVTRTYEVEIANCEECGAEFDRWKKGRYCSVTCRNKAYYAANKMQLTATKRANYKAEKAGS